MKLNFARRRLLHLGLTLGALLALASPVLRAADNPMIRGRTVLNLDGGWQIAEGRRDKFPAVFDHQVAVPGLVDMATPPFIAVGDDNDLREAFWYRRSFSIAGDVPPVAQVKIHKAMFGTKLWINGQPVGESLASFTPTYYDVQRWLRDNDRPNEIVIRVLAHRKFLPPDVPSGWDFEKYKYIPGIFDSVELILSGTPHIARVQTVPDLASKSVRIQATLRNAGPDTVGGADFVVREAKTRRVVGTGSSSTADLKRGAEVTVEAAIRIAECRLWSPEDPFLYEVETTTGPDSHRTRFGMRSFRFDPETGQALLNGQPYFLRGSNVTLYRFFEDSERKDRPWRKDWVRLLHQRTKEMGWNSLRYCIGFPPEFWYDIADELGILIQDEFPVWLLGGERDKCPENPSAANLIPQYTAWMQERWNHPCVVIWDAQNESFTAETGKALQTVRALDLSNRPWDNGWGEPQADTDCVEAHPYLMIKGWTGSDVFRMSEMPGVAPVPSLQEAQKKRKTAIVINEYAWLWLTRDGRPTCLTDKVYEKLLGPNSTVAQRRYLFARILAAKTEFWRARRKCAGVLHFCLLGYSRPGDMPRPLGGATSDHWASLEQLTFEPKFEEFVKEAFSPIGILADFWAETLAAGEEREVPVILTNDLNQPWEGKVRLRLYCGQEIVGETTLRTKLDPYGQRTHRFKLSVPNRAGHYRIEASLSEGFLPKVRSLRDFKVPAPAK